MPCRLRLRFVAARVSRDHEGGAFLAVRSRAEPWNEVRGRPSPCGDSWSLLLLGGGQLVKETDHGVMSCR